MEINLLPWRKEIITYNKNQFFGFVLAAIVLAGGLLWFVYSELFSQVIYDQEYVAALQNQSAQLSSEISDLQARKKTFELAQQKVITLENLQYSRFTTIKFFNEITGIIPAGIYLNSMARTDADVEVMGIANSNFLIAQLIKSIDSSSDITTLSLKKVERTEKDFTSVTDFDLQLAILTSLPIDNKNSDSSKPAEKGTKIKNLFDAHKEEIKELFIKKSLEKGQ